MMPTQKAEDIRKPGREGERRPRSARPSRRRKDPKDYGPELGEFPPVAPGDDSPQDLARPKDSARGGA